MSDPNPLDYGRPPRRPYHVSRWVAYPLLAVLGVAFYGTLIPSGHHSREAAMRARCASNLHQIGLAIDLYQRSHRGAYPDSLATLVRELPDDLFPGMLICDDSTDTPAAGPTTRAVADAVAAGGHCSYVYAGGGLTAATATPTTVVAYEPASHHGGGGNVLYGDGHAAWVAGNAMPATSPAVSAAR